MTTSSLKVPSSAMHHTNMQSQGTHTCIAHNNDHSSSRQIEKLEDTSRCKGRSKTKETHCLQDLQAYYTYLHMVQHLPPTRYGPPTPPHSKITYQEPGMKHTPYYCLPYWNPPPHLQPL